MATTHTAANDSNNGGIIAFILHRWWFFLPFTICLFTLCTRFIVGYFPTEWVVYSILAILFPISIHFGWWGIFFGAIGNMLAAGFKKYSLQAGLLLICVTFLVVACVEFVVFHDEDTGFVTGSISFISGFAFLLSITALQDAAKWFNGKVNELFGIKEKKK